MLFGPSVCPLATTHRLSALSPHSPWIRKWEPPLRKAAPPLGENPFGEALRHLGVLAQKTPKLLWQQELARLDKADKSKTK